MCIPFSLKIIKGILPYSSVIVTYYHSGECRRGVFPYFIYHDHDHLYLSVDGRGFKLNIILDDQSMFYTILQKVIRSFFFLFTLQSLLLSKQLIRDSFRDLLHEANEKECALLEERWLSEECMQAVMAFMQRKSKL